MRVTNAMLTSQALTDLDALRRKFAKAQAGVNGRALERPSEDPQRVVEAMDLSGMKLRIERAQRSGQDAREWLRVTENSLSAMIDRLQGAREAAMQAGNPTALDADAREGLALQIEGLRDSLLREMNGAHRDQRLFAGWKSNVPAAFTLASDGSVTYEGGSDQLIRRDIAPGLSIAVNLPGNQLLSGGDFIKTLSDMAANLRSGDVDTVMGGRLGELDRAMSNLNVLRSDMGVRQNQVEQYEYFSQETLANIEQRIGEITGVDLESAVLAMTEAQTAYQAALASFAKSMPNSLLDYMLR
ncbi:MAG TPA: flagellin [Symbiobacteriaceae bacterium]|jgi:flagellar hook-associated protein 3 FlgL|nr:flagellin [Symbiobacteriaceae bacterium]